MIKILIMSLVLMVLSLSCDSSGQKTKGVIPTIHERSGIESNNVTNGDIPKFHNMFEEEGVEVWEGYMNGKYGFELYFLATGGGWGGWGNIAIFKKEDGVQIAFYQDEGTYKTRQLTNDETNKFELFIKEKAVDGLPDWDTHSIDDGDEYQYMHFTDKNQVVLYINNPSISGGDVYAKLVESFFDLIETGEFDIH